MINLRNTFKKTLRDWGHDIFLQRRLSDDFVYSDQLERYTTRSYLPRAISLSKAKQEVPEGIVTYSDIIYYFEYNVNPKAGDRIYEESFNPLEDSIMYLIDESYAVRGRNGQITYWVVGATKEIPS